MATNPGTTKYVSLELFDKTAQEVYEDALAYATWVIPDWEPSEANIENVVMQALALMVAEGQYAINRLPGALTEILLQLYGITRLTGDYPIVSATFTVIDGSGYTIPAGTEVLYDLGDGGDPLVFSLNEDVVIAPASTSGVGVMTGNLKESRFNRIGSGTTLTVVTPLSYLLSVTTTTLVTGGTDAEDDSGYFNRGALRLGRLSEAVVLPRHYENYALEFDTDIKRAKTLDRYDPATGPTPGSNNGHVTIAVLGDGVPVSTDDKTALLTALQSAALSSLTLHVVDPENFNVIGVHASVVPLASASTLATNAAVELAVRDYLSPLVWPWASILRWTNIVALIEGADGVDYIDTLDLTINRIPWDGYVFYTTIANWSNTTNCTLAWDGTIKHNVVGGSMKITATAGGGVEARSAAAAGVNSFTATAAKDYWLSAFLFLPASSTPRTVRLGVTWYTAGNAVISSSETVGVNLVADSWVGIGEMFTAPALTAKANVYIEIDAAGAGQIFYVDEFTLSEYQTQNTNITLSGNGPLTMMGELVVVNP